MSNYSFQPPNCHDELARGHPALEDYIETLRLFFPSQESLDAERYEAMSQGGDFSFPGQFYWSALRNGELRQAAFLNSAALPTPEKSVLETQRVMFWRERTGNLSEEERTQIINETRTRLAGLMSSDPQHIGVGLCINGTHAMNISLGFLAGLHLSPTRNQGAPSLTGTVIRTDLEYAGTKREILIRREAGIPNVADDLASRPTYGTERDLEIEGAKPILNSLNDVTLKAYGKSDEEVISAMRDGLYSHPDTKTVIISHVDRHTGRELPIKELCRIIKEKNPNICIIIDGAQALGNVPKIEFQEIGCDIYIGCTQKAVGGEVCGAIFYDKRNQKIAQGLRALEQVSPKEQIIRRGMFEDVKANIDLDICAADLVGVIETIKLLEERGLKGNDFSVIDEKRRELRLYFLQKLQELCERQDLIMVLPIIEKPTNFIQSFRFIRMESRHNYRDLEDEDDQASLCREGLYLDNADLSVVAGSTCAARSRGQRDAFLKQLDYPYDLRYLHFENIKKYNDEADGHCIARTMAERAAFIAYLSTVNLLRASFHYLLSHERIDRFIQMLEETLAQESLATMKTSFIVDSTAKRWGRRS